MDNWYVARYLDGSGKTITTACDDKYKLSAHLEQIGITEYEIKEQTFIELAEEMKAMDRNNT